MDGQSEWALETESNGVSRALAAQLYSYLFWVEEFFLIQNKLTKLPRNKRVAELIIR